MITINNCDSQLHFQHPNSYTSWSVRMLDDGSLEIHAWPVHTRLIVSRPRVYKDSASITVKSPNPPKTRMGTMGIEIDQ